MAQLLEGKPIAERIKDDLRRQMLSLRASGVLASIRVGENPGVDVYARSQKKCAESLGIVYRSYELPGASRESEVIDLISRLNHEPDVRGIMVQTPLPEQINYRKIIRHISALKDVEGVTPRNSGWLLYGDSPLVPCTAAAVMELIASSGIQLRGKEAVIVGHSEIVGKPVALLLLSKFATVTVCHIATSEAQMLQGHVRRADILVVAVGKAGLIPGEWIKEGSVVIDVGINAVGAGITGDVVFEDAARRAAFITPVPGGVGPVTVSVLMRNFVEAIKLQS